MCAQTALEIGMDRVEERFLMQRRQRIFWLVSVAMLGTIGTVLMMLDFPLPGFPVYLKIDLSELPVLLGAIVFGPGAAIVIEGLKNLLHFLLQGSPAGVPIGEMANFVSGLLFVLPTAYVFKKMQSKRGLFMGIAIGVLLMAVIMTVLNYFIILPAYMWFLGFNLPDALLKFVVIFIMPFNLIKGILTGVVFLFLYPKLQPFIRRIKPTQSWNMV